MKIKNLVIGKSYYLDCTKEDIGVYIGEKEDVCGVFFMPIGKTSYMKDSDGSVGFMDAYSMSEVQ